MYYFQKTIDNRGGYTRIATFFLDNILLLTLLLLLLKAALTVRDEELKLKIEISERNLVPAEERQVVSAIAMVHSNKAKSVSTVCEKK